MGPGFLQNLKKVIDKWPKKWYYTIRDSVQNAEAAMGL